MAAAGCLGVIACLALGGVTPAVTEHGDNGRDRIVGTKGADALKGLGGRDALIGGKGADVLIGGKGSDVLIGGKGDDLLRGGPGRDGFNMQNGVQLAAPGRDKIDARDAGPDAINCGAGEDDVAIVDALEDGVYDCEVVREP